MDCYRLRIVLQWNRSNQTTKYTIKENPSPHISIKDIATQQPAQYQHPSNLHNKPQLLIYLRRITKKIPHKLPIIIRRLPTIVLLPKSDICKLLSIKRDPAILAWTTMAKYK